MDQLWAALNATWRILLIGLLLGAGLPALFSLGVRALSWGTGDPDDAENFTTSWRGKIVAWLLFAFVILCVVAGLTFIVAHGMGVKITFNGIVPVFTPKS